MLLDQYIGEKMALRNKVARIGNHAAECIDDAGGNSGCQMSVGNTSVQPTYARKLTVSMPPMSDMVKKSLTKVNCRGVDSRKGASSNPEDQWFRPNQEGTTGPQQMSYARYGSERG